MRPRDNPFRSERLDHGPYHLHGATWPALLARVLAQSGASSVLGPHGAGKSRLLRELSDRLRAAGVPSVLLRLDREPRPSPPPRGLIVLVDGLETQPPWRRRLGSGWWRDARSVIVARHVCGREPVLHECRPDFVLVRGLVDELVGGPAVADRELHALLQASPGDLRTLLRALYDRFAADADDHDDTTRA